MNFRLDLNIDFVFSFPGKRMFCKDLAPRADSIATKIKQYNPLFFLLVLEYV